MKNHVVTLCVATLLAVLLAGCGSSTPQPTSQEEINKIKADEAKHDAERASAVQQHEAESAAAAAAQTRGTSPPR